MPGFNACPVSEDAACSDLYDMALYTVVERYLNFNI